MLNKVSPYAKATGDKKVEVFLFVEALVFNCPRSLQVFIIPKKTR